MRSPGWAGTGTPATVIRSTAGSARSPRVTGRPFTDTRPSRIRPSLPRRDPYPAWARIRWTRCVPGGAPGSPAARGVRGRGSVREDGGFRRSRIVQEGHDRGEVGEGSEAQSLQEDG